MGHFTGWTQQSFPSLEENGKPYRYISYSRHDITKLKEYEENNKTDGLYK